MTDGTRMEARWFSCTTPTTSTHHSLVVWMMFATAPMMIITTATTASSSTLDAGVRSPCALARLVSAHRTTRRTSTEARTTTGKDNNIRDHRRTTSFFQCSLQSSRTLMTNLKPIFFFTRNQQKIAHYQGRFDCLCQHNLAGQNCRGLPRQVNCASTTRSSGNQCHQQHPPT